MTGLCGNIVSHSGPRYVHTMGHNYCVMYPNGFIRLFLLGLLPEALHLVAQKEKHS